MKDSHETSMGIFEALAQAKGRKEAAPFGVATPFAAAAKAEIERRWNNAKIGDEMPDGSVFAGALPDGGKVFAMPQDLSIALDFKTAAKEAEKLNQEKYLGHDDWRIPDRETLDILYQSRNAGRLAGTFGENADYWSSSEYNALSAWNQHFGSGGQYDVLKFNFLQVRCVRRQAP